MIALQATQLSKSYKNFQALAPTDLELAPGAVTVLTGPNGAGKSTLLMCLSGLLRPSTGSIQIGGNDLYEQERPAKAAMAFVPDVPRFYGELTGWEHLYFIAHAHDAGQGFEQRAERLLKEFGLWAARDQFPHNYSRGMSLKLGILLALIRPFKVLLLDEPTSALDPDSIQVLLARLKDLRDQGASILVSTHAPAVLEKLGDRWLRLENGQLSEN
jgi:ABC-2 type transport system ATP-binding protein